MKKILLLLNIFFIQLTFADTELVSFPEGQRPQILFESDILAEDMNVMFSYISQLRSNNQYLSDLSFTLPQAGDTITKNYFLTELYKNTEIYTLGNELDNFLIDPENIISSTELNNLFNKVMDDTIAFTVTCPEGQSWDTVNFVCTIDAGTINLLASPTSNDGQSPISLSWEMTNINTSTCISSGDWNSTVPQTPETTTDEIGVPLKDSTYILTCNDLNDDPVVAQVSVPLSNCPDLHILNENNVCVPNPNFSIEIFHTLPQERANLSSIDYISYWNEIYTNNDFMGSFSNLGAFTSQGYSFQLEVNCYETVVGECDGDTTRKILTNSSNFSDLSSDLFDFGVTPNGLANTYISLGEKPQEFTLTITDTNLNESASYTLQVPNYSQQAQMNISSDGNLLVQGEQSESASGTHTPLELFYLKKGNNFKFDLRNVAPEIDRYGNEFLLSQTRILLNQANPFQELSAFINSPNEPKSRPEKSRIDYDPATTIANTSVHEFGINTQAPDGWVFLETRFYGSNTFVNRDRILFFLGDTDPASFNGLADNTFHYQNNNIDSVDTLANLNFDVTDPEGITEMRVFPSLDDLREDEVMSQNIPNACVFSDPTDVNIRFRYDFNSPISDYSDNLGECVFNITDRYQTNIYVVVTDNQGEKTYEKFDIFFNDETPSVNLLANENDTSVTYNKETNILLTWSSELVSNCTTVSSTLNPWDGQSVANNEVSGFYAGLISSTTTFTINCESDLDQSVISDSVEVIIDLLCSEVANTDNIGDYNNGGSCNCLSGYSWDNTSNSCQLIQYACDSSQITALGGDPSLAISYSGTYNILDNSQCRIESCSSSYEPASNGLSCEQTAVAGTVQINAIDPISSSALTNGSRPINITWSTTNITNPASKCSVYSSPDFGWAPNFSLGNSSTTVNQNTTFTISCTDDLGQNVLESSSVNYITTNVSLSANSIALTQPNQSFQINLDYNGINNGTCTASNNAGNTNWNGIVNSGAFNLTGPSANGVYRYEISCPGIHGGTYTDFVELTVNIPFVNVFSNKTTITSKSDQLRITWVTSNVSDCQASGDWSGSKGNVGDDIFSASNLENRLYTYTLTCLDINSNPIVGSRSVSVNIIELKEQQLITINPIDTSDTVTLEYQGFSANVFHPINSNSIQTALNSIPTIISSGGVSVTSQSSNSFLIEFNTFGNKPAISATQTANPVPINYIYQNTYNSLTKHNVNTGNSSSINVSVDGIDYNVLSNHRAIFKNQKAYVVAYRRDIGSPPFWSDVTPDDYRLLKVDTETGQSQIIFNNLSDVSSLEFYENKLFLRGKNISSGLRQYYLWDFTNGEPSVNDSPELILSALPTTSEWEDYGILRSGYSSRTFAVAENYVYFKANVGSNCTNSSCYTHIVVKVPLDNLNSNAVDVTKAIYDYTQIHESPTIKQFWPSSIREGNISLYKLSDTQIYLYGTDSRNVFDSYIFNTDLNSVPIRISNIERKFDPVITNDFVYYKNNNTIYKAFRNPDGSIIPYNESSFGNYQNPEIVSQMNGLTVNSIQTWSWEFDGTFLLFYGDIDGQVGAYKYNPSTDILSSFNISTGSNLIDSKLFFDKDNITPSITSNISISIVQEGK